MTTMKPTLLLLAAAAVAFPAPATAQVRERDALVVREAVRSAIVLQRDRNQQRNRVEQTERISRTLQLGEAGQIELSNVAGDITISRGRGREVAIEAVKRAYGQTDEDARAQLGLVTVEITERGGRAEVRTRYPGSEMKTTGRRSINVSVQFTITAPAGTRITAKSISGDITTANISGDLSLETVSGDVRIESGERISAAKTISGNVEIVSTSVDGTLSAGAVSGTVTLRNVKARRVDLGNISGDIVLRDVVCERAAAQTVTGDVLWEGALSSGGRYDLRAHAGDVRLVLPTNVGFEVEASSFSGEVRSDFPLTLSGTDPVGRRRRLHTSARGVHGDGSAYLDLSTFSGSIIITKKP
jgi:DUF4097 and DUF4098 domain-containing protein YvlB